MAGSRHHSSEPSRVVRAAAAALLPEGVVQRVTVLMAIVAEDMHLIHIRKVSHVRKVRMAIVAEDMHLMACVSVE